MSSSLDHKCQRCGSQYHGQICPFCTITGLDVNALLAAEGLSMPSGEDAPAANGSSGDTSTITLVDVVSNRSFPVNLPVCRFGRDISNDIVLTGDKSLSRFHFQITAMNNEYFVEDAGSRNGTFLNGSPVTQPRRIENGDIISAGMTRYRFVLAAEPLAAGNGNGTHVDNMPPPPAPADLAPPMPPEVPANPMMTDTAERKMDPLDKLFAEGQALMNSGERDAADLDELFHKEKGSAETKLPENSFVQLDKPKETPVDELFQEQLRAMAAASASTPEPVAAPATPVVDPMQINTTPNEAVSVASPPALPCTDLSSELIAVNKATDNTPAPSASKRGEWPMWATEFSLSEINAMKDKMQALEEEIRARQSELEQLTATTGDAEHIKNSLLASEGQELMDTCSRVFGMLGWTTEANAGANNELVVSADGTAAAIVKVVCTTGQPKPAELANLVSSLSTYWSDHGVEPKGILLVSMPNGAPEQRPALADDLASYAAKKNVCLMTTLQLLAVYREAALRGSDTESIKTQLLGASGQLPAFTLA